LTVLAWPGTAGQGKARPGKARQGKDAHLITVVARTIVEPFCIGSSSATSAAAIVIAAQSSEAEIITALTTCELAAPGA
jgi:hypothetical protein